MYRSRRRTFVLWIIIAALLGMSGSATTAGQASQAEREDDPGSPVQLSKVALTYSLFDAVFNGLDADAAAELVGEDAVIETLLGTFTSPDGLIEFLSILHRANPDAMFGITSVTAHAGGVRIEWQMSATSYVTDPNESAAAVIVERSGTATITFEGQVVSATSLDYETAISPLPSDTVAVYPVQTSPGQSNF